MLPIAITRAGHCEIEPALDGRGWNRWLITGDTGGTGRRRIQRLPTTKHPIDLRYIRANRSTSHQPTISPATNHNHTKTHRREAVWVLWPASSLQEPSQPRIAGPPLPQHRCGRP
jgi:hypothetical protein